MAVINFALKNDGGVVFARRPRGSGDNNNQFERIAGEVIYSTSKTGRRQKVLNGHFVLWVVENAFPLLFLP